MPTHSLSYKRIPRFFRDNMSAAIKGQEKTTDCQSRSPCSCVYRRLGLNRLEGKNGVDRQLFNIKIRTTFIPYRGGVWAPFVFFFLENYTKLF
jgi:hypothetical protein